MSKVGADAATRNYLIKPRLEYRTLQGVNGPLVILEVRAGASASAAASAAPPPPARRAEARARDPGAAPLMYPHCLRALLRRTCGSPSSPRSST